MAEQEQHGEIILPFSIPHPTFLSCKLFPVDLSLSSIDWAKEGGSFDGGSDRNLICRWEGGRGELPLDIEYVTHDSIISAPHTCVLAWEKSLHVAFWGIVCLQGICRVSSNFFLYFCIEV